MLIAQEPPVVEALRQIDVNSLTPLETLTKLYELQKQVEETEEIIEWLRQALN